MGVLLGPAFSVVVFHAGATRAGPHDLAAVLVAVAAVFLLVCAADRSLGRHGPPTPG
ncbi:hypothetical protein [Streptomyces sp. NPDC000983]|uniref:hypothetical protein n=1 Tax=Streptomyces sp. NPDC000983 TaxID=3154373 RepID=UPI00331A1DE7